MTDAIYTAGRVFKFFWHSPDGTTNAKTVKNSHLINYHYP